MVTFSQKLSRSFDGRRALMCIGLDPDLERFPDDIRDTGRPFLAFNKRVIDATKGFCRAYKLQAAFYNAQRAEADLEDSIRYLREAVPDALVILDAKRGDVEHTARMYAREAFDRYCADAVTVNPFLGLDGIRPFLERQESGAILLCKTSNPGSGFLQDKLADDAPLYEAIAHAAEEIARERPNVMLVVGATYPQELGRIRKIAPSVPFLVPGVGSQDGDLDSCLRHGLSSSQKPSLLVSASRSIIYAGESAAGAIRNAAQDLQDRIKSAELQQQRH